MSYTKIKKINMKTLLNLIILFLSLNCISQNHYGSFTIDSKMKKAPYSFVWVKPGSLAILQTEVTVDHYMAFLEAVSIDSSEQYVKSLIPSNECAFFPYLEAGNIGKTDIKTSDGKKNRKISWIDEEKFLKENNHSSKEKEKHVSDFYYNPYNLPVSGLSYEQVIEYCKWCTAALNFDMKAGSKKKPESAVIFRLPSRAEFEDMLKKGIENCTNKDQKKCGQNVKDLRACKNEKGCALCNCSGKDTCATNRKIAAAFGENVLLAAYSFNPNWLGLYNMMGNAAEMTGEKGTAKGGSYLQLARDCQPESVQTYDGPKKWLGFRLVAEVKPLTNDFNFNDEGYLMFDLK
jgi:formylglycine-generating enzyme required for sulfatase activity